MAFLIGQDGTPQDSAAVDGRRRVAQALLDAGTQQQPIQSWAQGAANLASAGIGGLMMRDANRGRDWSQQPGAPLDIRPNGGGQNMSGFVRNLFSGGAAWPSS